MTCIVGYVRQDYVTIGGDSAGVDGHYNLTVRADPKVFRNGPVLIGFTSSFRMGDLLRYRLKVPPLPGGRSDVEVRGWVVTDLLDAVRATFREGGYIRKRDEREEAGTWLLGVMGRLFTVEDDLQVGQAAAPYAAVGCGAPIALGAMAALVRAGADADPRRLVHGALLAAEEHSAGVRGPFTVETLPPTWTHPEQAAA